nr:hypothetical protein [Tanacetum cinerariifolium]
MEEEFARENQRVSEQQARDSEIARLHAEEELKMMIEGLDRNNEVIAKHLREYEQAAVDLSVGEKLELIKQIKEKFIPVWKQLKDFVPMSSKEESERVKSQGLKINQGSSKRIKTSEDVSEEELKGMMQLVPLEQVYVEALQQLDREDLHQLCTLVKETFNIKQATKDKENELWVELKRLFASDFEDQLWIHNQALMRDPLDWKLYDTCGVHHVSSKDQEIFMLVEKDYLLRKGLATVMIILDEELIEASSPGYIPHNLCNKVSLIAALNSFKVTITLQANLVDPTLGNNNSGSGPRCQDTILGDVEAQTRFEAASKQFNDPSLLRVNTLGCGEDNIKLKELMEFCTKLSEKVIYTGKVQITTTIDGKVKLVSKASIRRHLKLEDSDGISTLPNTEIFKQLALMSSPTHTHVAAETASTGVDVRHGGAATIVTSLDAGQYSSNIDKTPSIPHDLALLRVNTLRSDEGSMSLQELRVLCTTLSQKVENLEADLKQTKQVYGAAYTKLIMKVKKLEKIVKTGKARRKSKIVVFDDEEEFKDPSKQGRNAAKVHTYTKRRRAVNTGSDGISTASRIVSNAEETVSTVGASIPVSTAGMIQEVNIAAVKDKGKCIMEESESVQTKTKRQQEQERLGLETAVRLQEQFDEEGRKRIARVQESAQTFTKEEWENIRARVETDEELTQRLQAEERDKYTKVDQAKMLVDIINQRKRYFAAKRAKERRNKPMTQAQQRTYMFNYIKHIRSYTLKQLKKLSFDEINELFEVTMRSINDFVPIESEDDKAVPKLAEARSLKRDVEEELKHEGSKKQKTSEASGLAQEQPGKEEKEDDLVMLWSLVKKRFSSTEPTDDKEKLLWVKLKRLFEPDTEDELWELQRYMHDPLTWRLYDTRVVYYVTTEKGMDIFMLIEKEYPLLKGLMTMMLVNKLLVDQHLEMENELVRKILMQVESQRK